MTKNIEWVGGRYTFPHEVRDGGSVFRPDVILWIELPRGEIVRSTVHDPRSPVSLAQSLEETMQDPGEGSARRPNRIRVADERSARELRGAAAGIPIVVAPVPELDHVFEELASATGPSEASYLGDGEIAPQLMAELFRAARLLFRTAPWHRIDDQQVVRVDVAALDLDGACLSVIGAAGESFGLLLFTTLDDFHAFPMAAERELRAASQDTGVAMRSISFDAADELPPPMLREVEQHAWPIAGPNAYPTLMCLDANHSPLPVTENDVRIITAVTRAFLAFLLRNAEVFESDDPELVRESSEGEDGVKVTLTAPYAIFEDESLPHAKPAMRDVGRNDPCPCGSGKKYKKCHLDADQEPRRAAAEIESVHEMDFRLLRAIARFATNRFGPDWLGIELEDADEDALPLILPWATWMAEADGGTVADSFLEQATRLSAEDREWIAGQRTSWLSIWEVTAVERGRIDVRDLLTHETRSVREEMGSEGIVVRDTVLARVIDYRGLSYFGGTYSRPLAPAAAAAVIDAVRAKLRLRRSPVPVERLRDRKVGLFVIDRWANAVADEDERRATPPNLQNTDGDPLQFVTESFLFDATKRHEIETRIEALDDFASAHTEDDERIHVFVRKSDDTVIGRMIVGREMLRIETNSEKRADTLAARVRDACGATPLDGKRTIQSPRELMREAPDSDEPPAEPSLEEQALLREFKESYYRNWLDMPIPALGDKTPRAAARSAKSRRELDLLLRDIENRENRLPEGQRFDFAILRRELGLSLT